MWIDQWIDQCKLNLFDLKFIMLYHWHLYSIYRNPIFGQGYIWASRYLLASEWKFYIQYETWTCLHNGAMERQERKEEGGGERKGKTERGNVKSNINSIVRGVNMRGTTLVTNKLEPHGKFLGIHITLTLWQAWWHDGADQAEIGCISSFKTIITDLKILTPAKFWARTRNRYLQFGWRSAARQHVLEPKKIWRKSKNILIKSEIHKILVMLGRLSWQTEKKCMKPSHLVPRRFELPRHRAINAGRQAVRRISAKIITRTST